MEQETDSVGPETSCHISRETNSITTVPGFRSQSEEATTSKKMKKFNFIRKKNVQWKHQIYLKP